MTSEEMFELHRLRNENASLSAWQCVYTDGKTGLVGDEHGNQYCAMARRVEALRAEIERLRVQNIQMQAALGYGIVAEDERHILPSNPFKCGTCDASKRLRAEVERLRTALREYECHCPTSVCEWFPCGKTARNALEEETSA